MNEYNTIVKLDIFCLKSNTIEVSIPNSAITANGKRITFVSAILLLNFSANAAI